MKPCVSILICSRNRGESLRLTLASVCRARIPDGWDSEIIVVDNGSSDSTWDIVGSLLPQEPRLKRVNEGRAGLVFARNAGIAVARGDVLLFTDDDVRAPPNWLEGMCEPFSDEATDAVQGGIRIAPHLERPWLKGALRVWMAAVEDPQRAPEGLVGANMAFRRKAVDMAGGFDIRLGPGAAGFFDDTLFGWALSRAGGKIVYRPSVAVEHHFDQSRLTFEAFARIAKRMAISRALVAQITNSTIRPTFAQLIVQLPGLSARCLTQALRFFPRRTLDRGFLLRYYRLCLWRAMRRRFPI